MWWRMDEQQFSKSVFEAKNKLFRISYSILHNEQDCADALQEALLRAWQHSGKLRDERYFDTWLVRILINESKRLRASRQRRSEWPAAPECAAEDIGLHDALMELDERYRLPIVLHSMEGYQLEEIAYLLRVPVGTVKSRMHTGRSRLKTILETEE